MKFDQKLLPGTLIKRYKRFLADIELASGSIITAHCPNSGSMLGCSAPGMAAMVSVSDNPKRKYPHTLELIEAEKSWVGINTSRTNHLIREALEKNIIKEIGKPDTIRPEVKVSPSSRLDFLVVKEDRNIYIEVKNCTLANADKAMFPDAVTARGTKHLHELLTLKKQGHGAYVIFCVQRMDASFFGPARHIDPVYAKTLAEVHSQGVGVLAYQADVSPEEIIVNKYLPVIL